MREMIRNVAHPPWHFDNGFRPDVLIIYQVARATGGRPIKLKQEAVIVRIGLSALGRPSATFRRYLIDGACHKAQPSDIRIERGTGHTLIESMKTR